MRHSSQVLATISPGRVTGRRTDRPTRTNDYASDRKPSIHPPSRRSKCVVLSEASAGTEPFGRSSSRSPHPQRKLGGHETTPTLSSTNYSTSRQGRGAVAAPSVQRGQDVLLPRDASIIGRVQVIFVVRAAKGTNLW